MSCSRQDQHTTGADDGHRGSGSAGHGVTSRCLLGSKLTLAEVIGSSGSDEYLEAVASGTDDGSVSEPLRKRLGANLRAERHRRALTQEALAEHLGVTARYLAGIERGERNLTLDSVYALASRLDLDALGLLAGRPPRP